jgi:hypothetical protein
MEDTCPLCGAPVLAGEGVCCYLCGRPFHLSAGRECGRALPNPLACCGLVHLCRPCAAELRLAGAPAAR